PLPSPTNAAFSFLPSPFCCTNQPAMRTKSLGIGLIAAIFAALGSGCNKSSPPPETKPATPAQPAATRPKDQAEESNTNTVARIHWLGKKRLAADTNATHFMEIWNMPESARLEAQTLDKLALAPWHSQWIAQATNPPSGAPFTNYATLVAN